MIIFFKVLTLYLIGIATMRILGKSTIVQMTPYDLLAIIIIGTVVSEPLISTEYVPTLISLGILTVLHIAFARLTLTSMGKKLFLGEPTLLIKSGQIVEDNLEKTTISLAQLLSILRSKGYPKVSDIDYAILEPIGELSILPKVENTPITVGHMGISIIDKGLPIAVIIDGKIQERNLELLNQSEKWLLRQLKKKSVKIEDIIYAFVPERTKELEISLRQEASHENAKPKTKTSIISLMKVVYSILKTIRKT